MCVCAVDSVGGVWSVQIFGEDEEEAGMAMAPPPSYSPPHEYPEWPEEGATSPPLPPKTSQVRIYMYMYSTSQIQGIRQTRLSSLVNAFVSLYELI